MFLTTGKTDDDSIPLKNWVKLKSTVFVYVWPSFRFLVNFQVFRERVTHVHAPRTSRCILILSSHHKFEDFFLKFDTGETTCESIA